MAAQSVVPMITALTSDFRIVLCIVLQLIGCPQDGGHGKP